MRKALLLGLFLPVSICRPAGFNEVGGPSESIADLLGALDLNKLNPILQSANPDQIGTLLKGLDLDKINSIFHDLNSTQIGALLEAVDVKKIAPLLKGFDFAQLDKVVKGLDFSKISPLLGFVDASKVLALAAAVQSFGVDLTTFAPLLGPAISIVGDARLGSLLKGVNLTDVAPLLKSLDAATIGNLVKSVNLAKAGLILQGLNVTKIMELAQTSDVSKLGPLIQGMDPSVLGKISQDMNLAKISPLLIGMDVGKLSSLVNGFDLARMGPLLDNIDLDKLTTSLGSSGLGSLVSPSIIRTWSVMFSKTQQQQHAMRVEQIQPRVRKTAQRVRMVYGPYRLKGRAFNQDLLGNAASMDPSGTAYSYRMGRDFPRNVTVLDVDTKVVDDKFEPLSNEKGLYDHHNVFFDIGSTTPSMTSCGGQKVGLSLMTAFNAMPFSILIGGAAETKGLPMTSADGTFNSGYYLPPNATVSNIIDIVNNNPDDKDVYVIAEIEYVPGKVANSLPATEQVLDIGMCDGKSGVFVHPPEGVKKWALEGSNITITQNGYILQMKSHMHDGGDKVEAFLNGKKVCESKAIYGAEGSGHGHGGKEPSTHGGISGTSICDNVVEVKPGDILRFTASFDTEKYPEREQEMEGMAMGMAEGMALMTLSFARGQAPPG